MHRRLLIASWLLFLLASPAPARTSDPAPGVSKWEPDIRAFEEADRLSPAPRDGILFVGSSSIRLWETLEADFAGLPVVNRAFGGSQIHEVNAFIDRIVLPYRPRLIVFYCGTNDIAEGRPVLRVVNEFKAFVRAVHDELPSARIAFISAAPNPARWHLRGAMRRLNREVAAYSRSDPLVDYIDVWTAMLAPNGRPKRDIFVEDRLHMNEKGYGIWKDVVGNYVRRVWKTGAAKAALIRASRSFHHPATELRVPLPELRTLPRSTTVTGWSAAAPDDPRSGSRR